MFNYVTVNFPTLDNDVSNDRIFQFTLRSERYAHEIAIVSFRDWDIPFSSVKPGLPVSCSLRSPEGFRTFYGYVFYVNPRITPGKKITDVVLIGASYVFKQASQKIFTNVSADAVVKQIAKENAFKADVVAHPRIWDQIAQAGHTDLELLTRLAKQCGYSLRFQDTTVYFKPFNYEFGDLRNSAPQFTMRDTDSSDGSSLYLFNLIVGDAVNYMDATKSAVTVSGVDAQTQAAVTNVSQYRALTINQQSTTEVFDRFATEVVAPQYDIAYYEALAEEAKNRYPYRAIVEVTGHPELRPDMPIYLDGLGPTYSGYWIVLNVEHLIREETLNNVRYTTLLEVGADSLGLANVWYDGTTVPYPNPKTTKPKSPAVVKAKTTGKTMLKNNGTVQQTNRRTLSA